MYLKIGQVAKAMQVSPTKVKQWILTGRLVAMNVGQAGKRPQYRIHEDDMRNLKPLVPGRKTRVIIDNEGINI
jgi:hypothetical protein